MAGVESLPVGGILLRFFGVQTLAVGPGSDKPNGKESNDERLISRVVQLVCGQLKTGHLAPGVVCGLAELGPLDKLGFSSPSLLGLQVCQKLLLLGGELIVLVPRRDRGVLAHLACQLRKVSSCC